MRPSISRCSLPTAILVPTPVAVKNAGTPAPAARMRSARVPCGTISSSILPARYSVSNTTGSETARERADDLADAPEFHQPGEADMADAGVVAGDRQVLGALLDQPVDQGVGLADRAEAAEQHDRAILDARHGVGHGLDDLVDHSARSLCAFRQRFSAVRPGCQAERSVAIPGVPSRVSRGGRRNRSLFDLPTRLGQRERFPAKPGGPQVQGLQARGRQLPGTVMPGRDSMPGISISRPGRA